MSREEYLLRLGHNPLDPTQPPVLPPQPVPSALWSQQQKLLPTSQELVKPSPIADVPRPKVTPLQRTPSDFQRQILSGGVPYGSATPPRAAEALKGAEQTLAQARQNIAQAPTASQKIDVARRAIGHLIEPLIGIDPKEVDDLESRHVLLSLMPIGMAGPWQRMMEQGAGSLAADEAAKVGTFRYAYPEVTETPAIREAGQAGQTLAMQEALGQAAQKGEALAQAAKYPQYAEEYPPVPTYPTWTARPPKEAKKGGGAFYLGRGGTPTTEQFSRDRLAINKQIDQEVREGTFRGHFNPEERFHVDPSNYPAPTDIYQLPKKRDGTIDLEKTAKIRKEVDTRAGRNRLQKAFDDGLRFGGHDRWYMMGQLEKAFTDELGPEEGRKRFLEWTRGMASTTSAADPETNLISTQYGRYLRQQGEPIPMGWTGKSEQPLEYGIASHRMPVPTSGGRLGMNMEAFQKYMNEGAEFGLLQPKRSSFSGNFTGYTGIPTIDEQMTKLITNDKLAAPDPGTYFAYAEMVRDMAARNHVPVDEFQAIVWGGKKQAEGKGYIGRSMIQIVNEALERTSRLTGMSPEEVLKRGIIRAEIPVYGLVGAAGAGAVVEGMSGRGESEQ